MIAMAAAVCVLTLWLICLVSDRESREVVDYICQRDEVCTMEWRRPVSTTARTADASKYLTKQASCEHIMERRAEKTR